MALLFDQFSISRNLNEIIFFYLRKLVFLVNILGTKTLVKGLEGKTCRYKISFDSFFCFVFSFFLFFFVLFCFFCFVFFVLFCFFSFFFRFFCFFVLVFVFFFFFYNILER